uniref:Uncharacterized protein n=1 Tax=Magallana gigas TaxID=29159 RepID=A0A8W8KL13_MAGGI
MKERLCLHRQRRQHHDHLVALLLPTLHSVSIGILQSTCRPPGTDGIPFCCPFYFLENNTCEECPPGYINPTSDINCSLPCSYPSYGARCEGRCNCSKEDCHHVFGCPVTMNVYLEYNS